MDSRDLPKALKASAKIGLMLIFSRIGLRFFPQIQLIRIIQRAIPIIFNWLIERGFIFAFQYKKASNNEIYIKYDKNIAKDAPVIPNLGMR